ncbi:uncharacterized protein LOC125197229 [Salvia hispanica]|uniref:uncharacterized protein LOC125197229 n=1 Tax=Salvia hispanica TaxID=49212 RepID=UPI002008F6D9|nr:uncharacterized protein LOC125197229 [Salvia hispanica]
MCSLRVSFPINHSFDSSINSPIPRLFTTAAAPQFPNLSIAMAEEEFQESDVVFRDCDEVSAAYDPPPRRRRTSRSRSRSAPVNIPMNAWRRCADDGGGEEGEMVPPHVIVGRRVAGKMMALSICGMILRKGRDLSEFRNLILRMTGFLET